MLQRLNSTILMFYSMAARCTSGCKVTSNFMLQPAYHLEPPYICVPSERSLPQTDHRVDLHVMETGSIRVHKSETRAS